MPINSFLYPGAKVTTGYNVDNSLRFDDGSSDHLTRTPASAGNRKTFTFSAWCKFSNTSTSLTLFHAEIWSTTPWGLIQRQSDNTIRVRFYDGTNDYGIITNRLFRDVSAWYHIVVAVDTTQGTASNRIKLYVNGVQETSFSTENYPSQNYDTAFNQSSVEHQIGEEAGLGRYFDGYMAETVLIDGSQLDATSFGEFDEDSPTIWKPIDVSGLTFGTNGFYLEFKQSGTSQNSSGLGADTSGQDNHFAVSNLTSVDQSIDTCTNNFATLNPLTNSEMTFSEGNTKTVRGGTDGQFATSTFEMNKGKWYFESKLLNYSGNSRPTIGLSQSHKSFSSTLASVSNNRVYYLLETSYYQSNNATAVTVNSSPATNDIYMWGIDLDNLKFYIGKNGTWLHSSDPSAGSNGLAIQVSDYYSVATGPNDDGSDTSRNNEWLFNFGSPAFAISSGNTDGEGYGNFEYAVPSGFFSMNSKNLAEYG